MITQKIKESLVQVLQGGKHAFWRNLMIVIGIVMVWRGVRHLLDEFLFPHNNVLSSIISMLGGIFILYLTDHTLKQLGGYETHRLKKIEAQRYHIKNKLSKKEEH